MRPRGDDVLPMKRPTVQWVTNDPDQLARGPCLPFLRRDPCRIQAVRDPSVGLASALPPVDAPDDGGLDLVDDQTAVANLVPVRRRHPVESTCESLLVHPVAHPIRDDSALEFGERPDDLYEESAERAGRVDRLVHGG